jgi:hypothetical protein
MAAPWRGLQSSSYDDLDIGGFTNYSKQATDSEPPMTGRRGVEQKEVTMRAEEGDESIGELADEAAKTKKELRESTETGEKVQKQEDADK